MKIEFLPRIVQSADWATLLFIATITLLAINKNVFAIRFHEYIKLFYSDKYIKIYRDTANLKSWFTISMFLIQLVSFSFIIHIFLSSLGYVNLYRFLDYLQIFNFFSFFVLLKYLIEKMIAICFDIEEFAEHYNLLKVNYRTYLGLLLLPIAILLFYSPIDDTVVLYITIGLTVLMNIILYWIILKYHQKIINRYFFYFILYLCTLEIAPYLILYKWFVIYKS